MEIQGYVTSAENLDIGAITVHSAEVGVTVAFPETRGSVAVVNPSPKAGDEAVVSAGAVAAEVETNATTAVGQVVSFNVIHLSHCLNIDLKSQVQIRTGLCSAAEGHVI